MTTNPHELPHANFHDNEPLQTPSRESLAAAIRSFLASEISAFEFDEQLDAFRDSDDAVIRYVVEAVWFHYDDCDDHLVCLTKAEWDYFQRLLLVLASDCRIEKETTRRWSLKQFIAAASLCGFAWFTLQLGLGYDLFLLAIPLGLISIVLSIWRTAVVTDNDPYQPIIYPFATFADLSTAYRAAKFRKTQYPKDIAHRSIRSPFEAAILWLQFYAMWLILSPIALVWQAFPEDQTRIRVKAA